MLYIIIAILAGIIIFLLGLVKWLFDKISNMEVDIALNRGGIRVLSETVSEISHGKLNWRSTYNPDNNYYD